MDVSANCRVCSLCTFHSAVAEEEMLVLRSCRSPLHPGPIEHLQSRPLVARYANDLPKYMGRRHGCLSPPSTNRGAHPVVINITFYHMSLRVRMTYHDEVDWLGLFECVSPRLRISLPSFVTHQSKFLRSGPAHRASGGI
jgi:hypothetical protein